MSLASRNEQLEAILAAKFDLECCSDNEKAECIDYLNRLLMELLAAHPKVSRDDLIEAISFKYNEYRAARIRAQRRTETL